MVGKAEERQGTALVLLGQPEQARRVHERALPLIEAGGDLVILSRLLINLGEACKLSGDLSGARHYTERAAEIGGRIGNLDQTAFILGNLGGILTVQGEWHRARDVLDRALALVGVGGRSANSASPLLCLGQLYLWEGDRDQAARYLREALEISEEAHDRQLQEHAQALLAERDLLQGQPDEGVARLAPMVAREGANLGLLLPTLAWAELERGEMATAAETAARSVERTREHEPVYLVDALRVQGMVLLNQEQHEEAERAFQEGLEVARSLPYPYAEARILEQMNKTEEALAIFRRLGAKKDIERIEAASAALRSTPG